MKVTGIGILWLFGMILFVGCSALHIENDYDPAYDFSKVRRMAIVEVEDENEAVSLARQRFARAIRDVLESKGYKVTTREKADLSVIFHLGVTRRRQIVTDYETMGFYPYCAPSWGSMLPVSTEYTWKEAKIVVDLVDPRSDRIVWRGVAVDRLKNFQTPRQRMAYARTVAEKIFASFPISRTLLPCKTLPIEER